MKKQVAVTDNNEWISAANGKPVRADGSVVQKGDDDAVANPQFGVTTTYEVDGHDQPKYPRVLSKTEFNKFGWATLGMAAFQKILEDVRKSTGTTDADYEARAAVTQYDAALTVAKSEVQAIGYKIKAAGHMTQEQFDAITGDNWPEA